MEEMEQIIYPIKHLQGDNGMSLLDQLRLAIESHVRLMLSHRRTAKRLFDIALDNLSTPKRKKIVELLDAYEHII